MKFFITLGIFLAQVAAFGGERSINCTGSAEGGEITIENLQISKEKIILQYFLTSDPTVISREYIVTEYMLPNGRTDINKRAYFIGATITGELTDYEDIALPHYGRYRSGLGSEIAFNHSGNRVFGTVDCTESED